MPKSFAIFALILSFCLSVVSNLEAQERNDYELLWEIQHKESSKKSYLFGTIHLKDKRVFEFSDAVIPAIRNSEAFALEIHPDSIASNFTQKIFDTNVSNIYREILSEEEYDRLNARYIKLHGEPLDSANFKSPLLVEAMLVKEFKKEDDKRTFLDAYLYGIAYSFGREIFGLEKIEDQLPGPEDISVEELRTNILDLLEIDDASYEKHMNEMIELYYAGNIEEIFMRSVGFLTLDKVLNKRNHVMVNSMEKIMKTKSLFAAVGAAHLPGREGIIQILKRKGYTVSKVEATFENVQEDFTITPNMDKWHLNDRPDLGYKVMTPTKAIPIQYEGQLEVMLSTDLIFGGVFGFMAVDLRGQILKKDFDFIENMINRQTGGNKDKVIKRETFEKNGIQLTDVTLLGPEGHTRMQFAFANKIVYSFYIQNNLEELDKPYINAFFESIEISKPEIEASTWSLLEEETGAFKVNYPGKLKDVSREVANPLGPEEPPYFLTMYLAEDKANSMIYIIRYNDQPNSYYMQDDTTHSDYMKEYFAGRGEIIGTPKPYVIGEYEGLEFEILLSGNYHTFARYFLRGNRTYLMLAQKSVVDEKTELDNPFFSSFKLEPYASSSLDSIITIKNNYSFQMPKSFKKEIDSLASYGTEYNTSTNYTTTQSNTGGIYSFTQTTIKPYYRVGSTAAFYDTYIETILEDNDTILRNKEVMVAGKPGRHLYIENSLTKVRQRLQLIQDNENIFQMIVYAGDEELATSFVDDYFKTFKILRNKKEFDLVSSKTKLIFKDLKSEDSIVQQQALDAFNYYDFEQTDSNTLYKSLDEDYGDLYTNWQVKDDIISALTTLGGAKNLQRLKEYYLDENTKSDQQVFILTNLLNFRNSEATNIYFDLLENHKPIREQDKYFNVFEILKDSLPLVISKEQQLAKLMEVPDYRDKLVSMYRQNMRSDSTAYWNMGTLKESIFKYMEKDVTQYLDTIRRNKENHLNYRLIDDYISIIDWTNTRNAQAQKVLSLLYTGLENRHWSKTTSMLKAIEFGFEIERPVIAKALEDLYSRFEVMQALLDVGQIELIPKAYLEAEAFSELSLFNAIGSSDAYPDILNKLGTFMFKNEAYIAYEYGYTSEEGDPRYMGVSKLEASNPDKFESNACYSNWDELESDWEGQAKKLLTEELE